MIGRNMEGMVYKICFIYDICVESKICEQMLEVVYMC